MKISIIIPTYNRTDSLAQVLAALGKQTFTDFELTLIDDGSAERTDKILDLKKFPYPIKYFYQKNKGPAAARNLGLAKISAGAELVLFLGDDTAPKKDFLAQHAAYHKKFKADNAAVLGRTEWAEDVSGEFTDFLDDAGLQFDYSALRAGQAADYRFFYTSNLSLKAKLLKGYRFDEDFKAAAYEDTELGYRLQKEQGLKIFYNPQAVAYHDHRYDFAGFLSRQKNNARWALLLARKHPEIRRAIAASPLKLAIYPLVLPVAFVLGKIFLMIDKKQRKLYFKYQLMRLRLAFNWNYWLGNK